MISAVMWYRSEQASSRSDRVIVTAARPRGMRTEISRDVTLLRSFLAASTSRARSASHAWSSVRSSTSSGDSVVREPLHHQVEQPAVHVRAAQLVVAVGGQHPHRAALDPQHRRVEGAAAEVIDQDRPVAPVVSP